MKKLEIHSDHWAHGLPMSAYHALLHTGADIRSRQDVYALAQSGALIQLARRTLNFGNKRLRDIYQWVELPAPIDTEKFTRRCIQYLEKHGYDVTRKERG